MKKLYSRASSKTPPLTRGGVNSQESFEETLDPSFLGSKIDQYVLPDFKTEKNNYIAGANFVKEPSSTKLDAVGSSSSLNILNLLNSVLRSNNAQQISPKSNKLKLCLINDDMLLTQYISWIIEQNSSPKAHNIKPIRIDFYDVINYLGSPKYDQEPFRDLNSFIEIFARKHSPQFKDSFGETDNQIFILENFDKIIPLIRTGKYEKISRVINNIAERNNLIVSTSDYYYHTTQRIFNFNFKARNLGYNSHSVKKYIRNVIEDSNLQHKIIKLLKDNPYIYKLAQQPKFLQAIIYFLRESPDNFSVTNLYNKIFRFHLNEPSRIFDLNDLFNKSPSHFIQKLAFESLLLNSETQPGSPIKRQDSSSSGLSLDEQLHSLKSGTEIYSSTFRKTAEELKKIETSEETIYQFLFYTGLVIINESDEEDLIVGRFTDQSTQFFLAAKYISDSYISREGLNQEQVRNFIVKNSLDPHYKLLMKFVICLIDLNSRNEVKQTAMNMFLSDYERSNEDVLKIYNNQLVKQYMYLLSDLQTRGIKEIDDKREIIDSIILPNLIKWREAIAETKYNSPQISEKLFRLLSGTRSDILEALHLLRKIEISDQNSLLSHLLFTVNSNDDYIAERSFEVIQNLEWSTKIKSLLQNLTHSERENLAVMSIESLAKYANNESLEIIINALDESSSPQVVFAAILVLENFASIKKFRAEIINNLHRRLLSEKDLTFLNSHQIILSLKALGLTENEILEPILGEFKSTSSDSRSTHIISLLNLLVNSFSPENSKKILDLVYYEFFNQGVISKVIKYHSRTKSYPFRAKAIELFSKNFNSFSDTEKNNIYNFIVEKTTHKNEIISKAAITALPYIFNFKPKITFDLLEKYTHGQSCINVKQSTLSSLTKAIISYPSTDFILLTSFLSSLLEQIQIPKEAVVNKERFESLKNIFPMLPDEQKTLVVESLVSEYFTIDNKSDIINFFSNVYDKLDRVNKDKIFNHLILVIELGNGEVEKIMTIKSLAGLYNFMPPQQQQKLAEKLSVIASDSSTDDKHEVAKAALATLGLTDNTSQSYEKILSLSEDREIVKHVFQLMDNSFHNGLPIKETTLREVETIYGIIFLIAAKTLSETKLRLLSGLLSKVPFNQEIITLIAQNMEEKSFKRTMKNLFPKINLKEATPHAISNNDKLLSLVTENRENLLISIDHNKIIINEEEFTLGGTLAENIDTIKLFLKNLQELGITYKLPAISNKEPLEKHLGSLDTDAIRLSIIDIFSDENDSINSFALIEEKTPFGSTLYIKIYLFSLSNEVPEFYIKDEDDKTILKSIFGISGEGISFNFKIYSISNEQKQIFLSESDSFRNFQNILDRLELSITDQTLIKIRYQTLLEEHPLEKRVESLENSRIIIENKLSQLENGLIDLKIDQKTIKETLDLIKIINDKKPPVFENTYKENLYYYVRNSLNEVFLAAKVVNAQTNMVKNNRKGIVGYLGSFFDFIAPHIPVIGVGVKILGTLLESVDAALQAKIVEQIASLAIDGNEMSQFSEEFAQFIINQRIDFSKISPNSFLEILRIVETSVDEAKEALHETAKFISKKTSEYSADLIKQKGNKDGEKIINFIITLLAHDKVELSNNFRQNLLNLESIFIKNYLLPTPLIINSLPRIRSASYDTQPKSPYSIAPVKRSQSLNLIERSISSDQIDKMESQDEDKPFFSSFNTKFEVKDITPPSYDTQLIAIEGPSRSNFNNEETPMLMLKDFEQPKNHNGLIGGLVMNGAAIMPQLEYLITKIPVIKDIIPYLEPYNYIAPYKHYIYSALHIGGNIVFSYNYGVNPIYSITSSTIFLSKPFIYGERNKWLENIEPYFSSELMKFLGYVATDSAISLAIALPFIPLTPYSLGITLVQGTSMGMINYYYSNNNNGGNVVGDIVGLGSTAYAASKCYYFAQTLPEVLSKLVVAEACIPFLASTHYLSKFAGDMVGDSILYIKENFIDG